MNTRAFLLASLIAGVLIGLFGGLPFVSVLNCVLCMWVWLGAILAVFLYRNFEGSKPRVTSSQGALLGLVAGLIGAVVVSILALLTRNFAMNYIAQLLGATGTQVPTSLLRAGVSFIGLFMDLVLYGIFGVVGGLIGAAIFKGPAPVPATTVVPPPAPYQAPAPVIPTVAEPQPEQPAEPQPEPPAEQQPPTENP